MPQTNTAAAYDAMVQHDNSNVTPMIADRQALLDQQQNDGHWIFDLESGVNITAEHVLLCHFLNVVDHTLERKIAAYLRRKQGAHGGWAIRYQGNFHISSTVKAYWALKSIGDDPDAPHMCRARSAILAHGGAESVDVFTQLLMTLFGEAEPDAVPCVPPEMILQPRWAPFHLSKVAYWSRVVMIPLSVVMVLRPQPLAPLKCDIAELFHHPDHRRFTARRDQISPAMRISIALEAGFKKIQHLMPQWLRNKAIARASDYVRERQNATDGLGGIYPAAFYSCLMWHCLGDRQGFEAMLTACRNFVVEKDDEAFVQSCRSPVWDTVLASQALLEIGDPEAVAAVRHACEWLIAHEIKDIRGDWASRRPNAPSGGWAFQYENPWFPDVDDTALAVITLHRVDPDRYADAIQRAVNWVLAMQSRNGGWGAFEPENEFDYFNAIPFADHGAMTDPPTVDVTARCVLMLGEIGYPRDHPAVSQGLDFILRRQQSEGPWHGRWGVNYIYGSWSVLAALNAYGPASDYPATSRAVTWLLDYQNPDGGWGEGCQSYDPEYSYEPTMSTPTQTAWALLALMAAGTIHHEAVRRGIAYLENHPRSKTRLHEPFYCGTGFPRTFYLLYHGYSAYFPLWALAHYERLMKTAPSYKRDLRHQCA